MEKKKQKTILDDLLEKYPDTPMDDDGRPLAIICPTDIGVKVGRACLYMSCYDCWRQPLPEKK